MQNLIARLTVLVIKVSLSQLSKSTFPRPNVLSQIPDLRWKRFSYLSNNERTSFRPAPFHAMKFIGVKPKW